MKFFKRHGRALAAVLLILTATVSVADTKPVDRVHVEIYSRPDAGEVYIDGKFVGSTDFAQQLTPGTHVIEVRREGWTTWRRELFVTLGNPTRVTALLQQKKK